tara:strand:+ start:1093 stop:1332 length:240 start_codon:yes stop_codon:yes gene_type:complete
VNEYKLSDEVISNVARQLQIALLTGTDIVDNLRLIRVVSSDEDEATLVLSPEYRENSEKSIQNMLDLAEAAANTASEGS